MVASFFFLWGIVLVPVTHGQRREYHFININLTWAEARQYCRENFTDLATVETQEDLRRVFVPEGVGAWIGLFDDPASWYRVINTDSNSWRWSATGDMGSTGFMNWRSKQPNYALAIDNCTNLLSGTWVDTACSKAHRAICYTVESSVKQFNISESKLSWDESVEYCRRNYHDLAMIESAAENQAASSLANSEYVWIGLYREAWRWSDNSNSYFKNWAISEPNNALGQEHCVEMNSDLLWEDTNCESQLPFICFDRRMKLNIFQLKFQSTSDLSDSAVNSQVIRASENITGFSIKWIKTSVKS